MIHEKNPNNISAKRVWLKKRKLAAAAGEHFVLAANDRIEREGLTPFCYCENCFALDGITILMADHCFNVPVASSC